MDAIRSKEELVKLLSFFRQGHAVFQAVSAFSAVPNNHFQLELPYSHLIMFSSLRHEHYIFLLRKAFKFPYFHVTGPNGKSVFVEVSQKKRLVVDFAFKEDIEEKMEHYSQVLFAYLETAEQLASNKKLTFS